MDFFTIYQNLPTRKDQKDLRHNILKSCRIEKPTFYSWMTRNNVPDEKNRLIIASILDQPVEILFPQNK
jgi:hypothetical protein